ncbi:MAG: mechanosensitive ion channel, partial [Thermodesulfobacteriota bacterium]|nr:mechanosensitive ion channel [Thermodesulfobacteriota bacterium]
MVEYVHSFLVAQGIDPAAGDLLARGILVVLAILLSIIANIVAKRITFKGLTRVIVRTETRWDDILLERKVFTRLSHLAPAIVLYIMLPLALEGYDGLISFTTDLLFIYIIIVGILVCNSLLNAVLDIYRTMEISKEIPIQGFIQILKVVLLFIVGIFIISILLDKTPLFLFSGLGALTAVLLLIFKDAILGFVAGIQLAANKMVAHGDWIEMPKYGADGDVLEVALTTVKVQNWDKTVTTIPTYALISESFKNWRGMQLSGG